MAGCRWEAKMSIKTKLFLKEHSEQLAEQDGFNTA